MKSNQIRLTYSGVSAQMDGAEDVLFVTRRIKRVLSLNQKRLDQDTSWRGTWKPFTKERLLEKSCSGKKCFSDKKEALTVINSLVRKGECKRLLSAYRCSFCNSWHVGHRAIT